MKKPFMGYSTPEKKICLTREYVRSKGKGKSARREECRIKEMKEEGSRGM
ncbi:MAG: hypothetical protein HS132_12875 [Planctomycetia bacterium]|nr:hypothetical protein [Planctomycetia bacterium]